MKKEHPTVSFRLDKETKARLIDHLEGTGCSFADFMKDALGREETMVEKRVQILASQKVESSVEDRLKCVESLVNEVMTAMAGIAIDDIDERARIA